MIKAVIFDVDGLMFDTERVFIKAWDYAGEKIGIGPAGFMVFETMGMSIEASKDLWLGKFGSVFDVEQLKFYTKEFLNSFYEKQAAPVKSGLLEVLRELKIRGYLLGVASSSPRWEVERHLKSADIFDYFQVIVTGDMVARTKPDPEIYLRACRDLGCNPEECIALEDSKNGILSAYASGCRPIMIPDIWQPNEEFSKYYSQKCECLVDVLGLV